MQMLFRANTIFPLGVVVSFKHSEYTVKESDGRVPIAIQAVRNYYSYHVSFYVKIRASVSRNLNGDLCVANFIQDVITHGIAYSINLCI